MSIQDTSAAPIKEPVSAYRFTVEQYHEMVEAGILGENDRIELIEGNVLQMSPKGPRHVFAVQELLSRLAPLLPAGWHARCQDPLTLSDSEPEPDIAVVRGARNDYVSRHPGLKDTGLVIEVADASVELDRTIKQRIYAAAGIPTYLLINLAQRQAEIFTQPQDAAARRPASYRTQRLVNEHGFVETLLAGQCLGEIRVSHLMPPPS
jgi:Uma2 family endonuclease